MEMQRKPIKDNKPEPRRLKTIVKEDFLSNIINNSGQQNYRKPRPHALKHKTNFRISFHDYRDPQDNSILSRWLRAASSKGNKGHL